MSPQAGAARRETDPAPGDVHATLSICGLSLLLFGGIWLGHAAMTGRPAATVSVFPPGSDGPGPVTSLLTTFVSVFVALFLPGLALVASRTKIPAPAALVGALSFRSAYQRVLAGFGLSLGLWLAVTLSSGGIHPARVLRSDVSLYASLLLGLVSLAVIGRAGALRLSAIRCAFRSPLLWMAAGIALAIAVHYGYLSFNTLSDDEIEAAEFALSLDARPLPYWDLENGTWGFYPTFMLFAYPAHALIGALGHTEFGLRMLFFVSLFVSMCGAVSILEHLQNRRVQGSEVALLIGAAGVVTTVGLFYNSWHPYVSGAGEPSGVDMFGFALFLASVTFFYERRAGWFLVFAWAHYAALPNGGPYALVWMGLGFVLLDKDRLWIARTAALYLLVVAAYELACGLARETVSADRASQFSLARMVDRYLTQLSGVDDWLAFARLLLVLSGGAIVLVGVLVADLRHRDLALAVSFLALHTVVSGLAPGLHHPHYHLSLMLLVCVLALVALSRFGPALGPPLRWSLAAAYVAGVLLLTPRDPPALDNARQLAAVTRLDCPVRDLRALYDEAAGLVGSYVHPGVVTWRRHGLEMSVWLHYVLRAPSSANPSVIIAAASSPVPAGFRRLSAHGACQVLVSETFDADVYKPVRGYRDMPVWSALAVRRWREHF